ncbi:hypothetical protein CHS0354_020018, partial [Potamilus streckersoni]
MARAKTIGLKKMDGKVLRMLITQCYREHITRDHHNRKDYFSDYGILKMTSQCGYGIATKPNKPNGHMGQNT